MNETYTCARCHGQYEYVNDEEWNVQKANDEYSQNFPGCSEESKVIICDDCYKVLMNQ